jgi:hypothetical protein
MKSLFGGAPEMDSHIWVTSFNNLAIMVAYAWHCATDEMTEKLWARYHSRADYSILLHIYSN